MGPSLLSLSQSFPGVCAALDREGPAPEKGQALGGGEDVVRTTNILRDRQTSCNC